MNHEKALVWFRRDLRDHDHAALSAALSNARQVYCAFVFDTDILDTLPSRRDRRVHFIRDSLAELDAALRARGGGLIVRHGRAVDEITALAARLGVAAVFANRDYEPAAKARDAAVTEALEQRGISFHTSKDQAIFDGDEVLTQSGKPYTVFTPYKNAWLKRLTPTDHAEWRCAGQLAGGENAGVPTLEQIGFVPADLNQIGIRPGMSGARALWDDFRAGRIARYGQLRDFPAIKGVSYLSVHLRFGTVSIRELVRTALAEEAGTWLNELIWRDFYFMILDHFPQVVGHAFKAEYDAIRWVDWPAGFAAWQAGRTGYPLVDAAMRQLNHCGWMHNRLRMVVASFLTKDLGIDWRLGERHFAEQLNDFDLSANNGGWQWAASSGCDAQPYFRIFNPVTQSEKFDPEGKFIRRYVPELAAVPNKYIHAPWTMGRLEHEAIGLVIGRDYPAPIVDHKKARDETLARYSVVKKVA
ncbi:DNA photolyase family protein [Dechloromonas sp. XY25]|uniref:DNA photolyase family protein n=1 Tax=Dechloromonas hankyongensis TaxID=2908002 RepID=A0ABS9JX61_9RHOO|nr:deoxyribodipyrimidine photo-lyase [Dechloromonas hankyongensis]MCG2575504.1 DNA photolyase family protein [Dechloromonas hankyongensis]